MQYSDYKEQLTLGKMIRTLEDMPSETIVAGLCNAHSYRGYYDCLAFSEGIGSTTASILLERCYACVGKEFTGYKGGRFVMRRSTPIFVANWGECGKQLIAVNLDGTIETAED